MNFNAILMGANFRDMDTQVIVQSLEDGDTVSLEREPDNKYDPNAVKVHFKGSFLGYIAKAIAAQIAPLMDDGFTSECTVLHSGGLRPMLQLELSGNYDEPGTD